MNDLKSIPSLAEIDNYPIHYLTELASESRDSALLYQYGPYLTYNYNDKVSQMLLDRDFGMGLTHWNPIFRLFCEVSMMLHAMNMMEISFVLTSRLQRI